MLVGAWLTAFAPQARAAPCSDVLVIAARGSGETPDAQPGATIRDFIEALRPLVPAGQRLLALGLRYPAVPVIPSGTDIFGWVPLATYGDSVSQGVAELRLEVTLAATERSCPDRRIVLAGYSQGADVIARALPLVERYAHKVAAVVMFASPQFEPAARSALGSFDPMRRGIFAGTAYAYSAPPPSAFRSIYSFCRDQDPVCQGIVPARTLLIEHELYGDGETGAAANLVAADLRRRSGDPRRCGSFTYRRAGTRDLMFYVRVERGETSCAAARQLLRDAYGGRGRTVDLGGPHPGTALRGWTCYFGGGSGGCIKGGTDYRTARHYISARIDLRLANTEGAVP